MRIGGCVVFDIDDTLYLEREYVRSGFRAVGEWARRQLGVADASERAWRAFLEGRRGAIFDEVLRSHGISDDGDGVRRMVEVYRSHTPNIQLLPDASACLNRLTEGVPIGIVTDGPAPSQRAKIAALGLDRLADPIVVTAELGDGQSKPSPAPFEIVEQRTGFAGGACVYVADNPAKDFAGPRSLGWITVRVRRWGGLHREEPSGADVDGEIASLHELELVIERLRSRTGGPRR